MIKKLERKPFSEMTNDVKKKITSIELVTISEGLHDFYLGTIRLLILALCRVELLLDIFLR